MGLLERLGIPRWRLGGLSVFNFVGTFLITFLLTRYLYPFTLFTWFELSCASIPFGLCVHVAIGDTTPLTRRVRGDPPWLSLMVLLAGIGVLGTGTVVLVALAVNVGIIILRAKN